ncbi:MAG TPA: hypothetical protein VH187_01680 [Scandinavium sp.]|jgi:hypothetical protein|uniref:hypothetical protein n=1 Tax=Scandinavium sp. TaxID=2830653 RepID=UPI002E371C0E|nr:hypothetical protein [Scandinavium sp.]HEX4499869.1 hypothetical protein [Scandinavium sp.]
MRKLIIILILAVATGVYAQQQSTPVATPSIESQLQEVGCKAERQAAAATIVELQKQLAQLRDQLTAAQQSNSKSNEKGKK